MRYLHDEEATSKAFTPDGYFRTGDLGHTEADGSWSFHTRIGDAMRIKKWLEKDNQVASRAHRDSA